MTGADSMTAAAPLSRVTAERISAIYLESRNRGELGLLDAIFDPTVVVHDCGVPEPLRGLETLKAFYRQSHEGMPDLHFELGDPIVDGDRMALRWTASGTHTGTLRGLPPTGKTLRFSGTVIDRVVDERIVEEWVDYDTAAVLLQLGFTLVPPGAGADG
ncbi:MAG: ester cyclase [Acidobacteriota bacterium]